MKRFIFGIGVLTLLGCFSGCCSWYSFTSKTLDNRIKNISITPLQNQADIIVPALNFELTEAIREIFLRQTSLKSTAQNGDYQFSGAITRYYITPIAVQSAQTPNQNRLTMNVKITFVNTVDNTKNYEQEFSNFIDFLASQDLVSVQKELNTELNKKIAQDIFNKTLGDW